MKESAAIAGAQPVAAARVQRYLNDADLGVFQGDPNSSVFGLTFKVEAFTEATVQAIDVLGVDAAAHLQLFVNWWTENDTISSLRTLVLDAGSGWVNAGFWGAGSFSFARSALVSRTVRLNVVHNFAFSADAWSLNMRLMLRGRPVHAQQGFRV